MTASPAIPTVPVKPTRTGERPARSALAVGIAPTSTPRWLLAALMILVGLGGPTVAPPATAVLLDAVPQHQAGVASGVFNTSRQVGGALAVAVFGGLLAQPDTFVRGVRTSLAIAAGVLALTGLFVLFLPSAKETQ